MVKAQSRNGNLHWLTLLLTTFCLKTVTLLLIDWFVSAIFLLFSTSIFFLHYFFAAITGFINRLTPLFPTLFFFSSLSCLIFCFASYTILFYHYIRFYYLVYIVTSCNFVFQWYLRQGIDLLFSGVRIFVSILIIGQCVGKSAERSGRSWIIGIAKTWTEWKWGN